MPPVLGTDATLTGSVVKAVHSMEPRAALANVYSAAMILAPVYTDSTVDPGVTIKVAHRLAADRCEFGFPLT